MHARFLSINEVKCNFCFNWINGEHLVKYSINACRNCVDKYRGTSFKVHTETQQIYMMSFNLLTIAPNTTEPLPGKAHKGTTHQEQILMQPAQQLKQIIPEQTVSQYQDEPSQQLQVNPKVLDFMHISNISSKSILKNKPSKQHLKPHQSLIFTTPCKDKQKLEFFTQNGKDKYDSLGKSLSKTRFISRYQFHYEPEVIEEFIQQHPKIQERTPLNHQFGQELDSNQLHRSLKFKDKTDKLVRSKTSNTSLRSQKIKQEEMRVRISGLLQSKNHSDSLNRIISTNIKEIYDRTCIRSKTLELVGSQLSTLDLQLYLSMFDFQHINVIKFLNVGLTDEHIPILLSYIWNEPVESLVLTGNRLTQGSLSSFLTFTLPNLKELYLGNNRINKSKIKQNITELHTRYILYL